MLRLISPFIALLILSASVVVQGQESDSANTENEDNLQPNAEIKNFKN